jgi:hypothetical protein
MGVKCGQRSVTGSDVIYYQIDSIATWRSLLCHTYKVFSPEPAHTPLKVRRGVCSYSCMTAAGWTKASNRAIDESSRFVNFNFASQYCICCQSLSGEKGATRRAGEMYCVRVSAVHCALEEAGEGTIAARSYEYRGTNARTDVIYDHQRTHASPPRCTRFEFAVSLQISNASCSSGCWKIASAWIAVSLPHFSSTLVFDLTVGLRC